MIRPTADKSSIVFSKTVGNTENIEYHFEIPDNVPEVGRVSVYNGTDKYLLTLFGNKYANDIEDLSLVNGDFSVGSMAGYSLIRLKHLMFEKCSIRGNLKEMKGYIFFYKLETLKFIECAGEDLNYSELLIERVDRLKDLVLSSNHFDKLETIFDIRNLESLTLRSLEATFHLYLEKKVRYIIKRTEFDNFSFDTPTFHSLLNETLYLKLVRCPLNRTQVESLVAAMDRLEKVTLSKITLSARSLLSLLHSIKEDTMSCGRVGFEKEEKKLVLEDIQLTEEMDSTLDESTEEMDTKSDEPAGATSEEAGFEHVDIGALLENTRLGIDPLLENELRRIYK